MSSDFGDDGGDFGDSGGGEGSEEKEEGSEGKEDDEEGSFHYVRGKTGMLEKSQEKDEDRSAAKKEKRKRQDQVKRTKARVKTHMRCVTFKHTTTRPNKTYKNTVYIIRLVDRR